MTPRYLAPRYDATAKIGGTLSWPAPPAPKRRERDIQRAILDLLHAHNVLAWKAGSGAFRVQAPGQRERYVRMGHTGVADIIGVLPQAECQGCGHPYLCAGCPPPHWHVGRFLAIEVKQPGGVATGEQAAFLASVRKAGGIAFVATSCADVARELGWP